jgi:hypothetical protein
LGTIQIEDAVHIKYDQGHLNGTISGICTLEDTVTVTGYRGPRITFSRKKLKPVKSASSSAVDGAKAGGGKWEADLSGKGKAKTTWYFPEGSVSEVKLKQR